MALHRVVLALLLLAAVCSAVTLPGRIPRGMNRKTTDRLFTDELTGFSTETVTFGDFRTDVLIVDTKIVDGGVVASSGEGHSVKTPGGINFNSSSMDFNFENDLDITSTGGAVSFLGKATKITTEPFGDVDFIGVDTLFKATGETNLSGDFFSLESVQGAIRTLEDVGINGGDLTIDGADSFISQSSTGSLTASQGSGSLTSSNDNILIKSGGLFSMTATNDISFVTEESSIFSSRHGSVSITSNGGVSQITGKNFYAEGLQSVEFIAGNSPASDFDLSLSAAKSIVVQSDRSNIVGNDAISFSTTSVNAPITISSTGNIESRSATITAASPLDITVQALDRVGFTSQSTSGQFVFNGQLLNLGGSGTIGTSIEAKTSFSATTSGGDLTLRGPTVNVDTTIGGVYFSASQGQTYDANGEIFFSSTAGNALIQGDQQITLNAPIVDFLSEDGISINTGSIAFTATTNDVTFSSLKDITVTTNPLTISGGIVQFSGNGNTEINSPPIVRIDAGRAINLSANDQISLSGTNRVLLSSPNLLVAGSGDTTFEATATTMTINVAQKTAVQTSQSNDNDQIFVEATGTVLFDSSVINKFAVNKNSYWEADNNVVNAAQSIDFDFESGNFYTLTTLHQSLNSNIRYDTTDTISFNSQTGTGTVQTTTQSISFTLDDDIVGFGSLVLDQSNSLTFNTDTKFVFNARSGRLDDITISATTSTTLNSDDLTINGGELTLTASSTFDIDTEDLFLTTTDSRSIFFNSRFTNGFIDIRSDQLSFNTDIFFLNVANNVTFDAQDFITVTTNDLLIETPRFFSTSTDAFRLSTNSDLNINADTSITVTTDEATIKSTKRDVDFFADSNFKSFADDQTRFNSPSIVLDSDSNNDLIGKTSITPTATATFTATAGGTFTNMADSISVTTDDLSIIAPQTMVNSATHAFTINSVDDLTINTSSGIFEGGAFHLNVGAALGISTAANILISSTTPKIGNQNDHVIQLNSGSTFGITTVGHATMTATGNYEVGDVAISFASTGSDTTITSSAGGVLLSGDNGVSLSGSTGVSFLSSSGIISNSENGAAHFETSSGNIDITAVNPSPVIPSRDILVSSAKGGLYFVADQGFVSFRATSADQGDFSLLLSGDLSFDLSSPAETSSNSLSFIATNIAGDPAENAIMDITFGKDDFILDTKEGITITAQNQDFSISASESIFYRTHAQSRPSAPIDFSLTGDSNGPSSIIGQNGVDMFSSLDLSFQNTVSGPMTLTNNEFYAKSGSDMNLSFGSSSQALSFTLQATNDLSISTHGILGDITIENSFAIGTITTDSFVSRAAQQTTFKSAGNYVNSVQNTISFTTDNPVEKTRIESLNEDITFQSNLANVANANPFTVFVEGRHIDFSAFDDVTFDPALFQIGRNNDKFNPVVLIEAGGLLNIESVGSVTFTATNEKVEIKTQSTQSSVFESSLLVQSNGNIDVISTGNNNDGASNLRIEAEQSNLKVVAFDTIHASSGGDTTIQSDNTVLFSSTGTTSSDALTISAKNHAAFQSASSSNFTTSQNIVFKATSANMVGSNTVTFSSVDPVRRTGQLTVQSDGTFIANSVDGDFIIQTTKNNGKMQFQTQFDRSDILVQTQQANSDITVTSAGSIEVNSRSVSQTAAFEDLTFRTLAQGAGKISVSSTSNVNFQALNSFTASSQARLFIDTDGDINVQSTTSSFVAQDNLAFETANGQGGKIYIDNYTTSTFTASDELTLSADNDFEILSNGTFSLSSPNTVDFSIDGWLDISNDIINFSTLTLDSNIDFISTARTKIYSSGPSGIVSFNAKNANFDSVNGVNIRASKVSDVENDVSNAFIATDDITLTSSDDISFTAFQSISSQSGDSGTTFNARQTSGTSMSFISQNPTGNVLFTATSFASFTGSDSFTMTADGLGEGRGTMRFAALTSECVDCANHGIDIAAADVLLRSSGDIISNSRETVISGKQVTITSTGGISFTHNGGDQQFESIEIASLTEGNIEFETQTDTDSSIVIRSGSGFAKTYANYKTRIVQTNSAASVDFIASGTFAAISQRSDTHPGIQFLSSSPQFLNALDKAMEFKGRNVRYTLLNNDRSASIQSGTKFGAIIDFQLTGTAGNGFFGTSFTIRNANGPLSITSTCSSSDPVCPTAQLLFSAGGISTYFSQGNTIMKAGATSFQASTRLTFNPLPSTPTATGLLPKLYSRAFFGADERGLDNQGDTGAVTIDGDIILRFRVNIADGAYCPFERELSYGNTVTNGNVFQLCVCEDHIWSCALLS